MTANGEQTRSNQPVFEKQFELLKLEMTLIGDAVRSQDDIMKSIKNWAIVTWTASVGFAVANPPLVRVQEIARFINGPLFTAAAASGSAIDFPLMQMRSESGAKTSWSTVMRFRTVATLYLLMIAGSMVVAMLLALGGRLADVLDAV